MKNSVFVDTCSTSEVPEVIQRRPTTIRCKVFGFQTHLHKFFMLNNTTVTLSIFGRINWINGLCYRSRTSRTNGFRFHLRRFRLNGFLLPSLNMPFWLFVLLSKLFSRCKDIVDTTNISFRVCRVNPWLWCLVARCCSSRYLINGRIVITNIIQTVERTILRINVRWCLWLDNRRPRLCAVSWCCWSHTTHNCRVRLVLRLWVGSTIRGISGLLRLTVSTTNHRTCLRPTISHPHLHHLLLQTT